MKEITLKIPDQKVHFFMELIDQLGFEVSMEGDIPTERELIISEEHKSIVRERILKSSQHPERLMDWEKEQEKFKLD